MARWTVVLASLLLVDIIRGQDLTLRPQQEVVTKSLGSSMVFSCAVEDLPADGSTNFSGLHWIDNNNQEVTAKTGSSRVYIEDDGPHLRKLYFTGIRETDAGTYTCRSKISNSWRQKPIRLVVFKDITFDNAPLAQNPAIGTDALIVCEVSGIPKPIISWLFDDKRLHFSKKFVKEEKGLRINGITEADNGDYICRAEVETDGRYDERRIQVAVSIPPKITVGLKPIDGVEGTDLAMSCRGQGLPSPLYEFFKDNDSEPLAPTSRIHIDNSSGDIYFSPVEKSDEGRYTCRVSNGAGIDTSVGELRISVPPSIEMLELVVVHEGSTAVINCNANGDPAPEMSFQWVGDKVIDLQRVLMVKSDGSLKVTVIDVDPSDSGNFTCHARNAVGSDTRTGVLKVLYKPRFPEDQRSTEYIWADRTHNISCRVLSVPEPEITWYRHGILLSNNSTYQIISDGWSSNLQIHVKQADQGWIYGTYVCQAKNEIGEAQKMINLNRATIPDTPSPVQVVDVFPTQVVLQATPPDETGGLPLLGYRVEYEDKVQDFSLSDNICIEGLKPSTAYIFRVRAKNEVGAGSGNEIRVTTADIRQPYPIEITSNPEGRDAYYYVVTWKPPINGGLPIKKFSFSWRLVSVEKGTYNISEPLKDWVGIETDSDLPLNFYQLNDLEPLSYYELEIKSFNNMGPSDPSKQFVFHTAEDLLATPKAVPLPTTTSSCPACSLQTDSTTTTTNTTTAFRGDDVTDMTEYQDTGLAFNASESTGTDPHQQESWQGANATVPIVTIIIIVILLFLVIVDVSCYFLNSCGLTMYICVHVCGRDPPKEKSMEEGESDKKPLSDAELEPLAAHHSGSDSEYKVPIPDGAERHPAKEYTNGVRDSRVRLKPAADVDVSEGSDVLPQEAVVHYERDSMEDNEAMQIDEPNRIVT